MLLPAGRRLQLFYRRTFLSAEQIEAGLLFRLFTGRWFGSAARAHATLPASLPFRCLCSFASPLRIKSALALGPLDCVNPRLIYRM
jgi:hypothetical protein